MTKEQLCFVKVQHPWQYDPFSDPPLGMLSVAAEARSIPNLEVALSDMANLGKVENSSQFNNFFDHLPPADFYAFSASTLEFPGVLNLAFLIKRNSSSKVIVGGPHFDVMPEKYWEDQINSLPFDIICRGEGESNIHEAISDLRSGKLNQVITQKGPLINMDQLPFPARDLLNKVEYFKPGKTFAGGEGDSRYSSGNSSTIMVSRGCPFVCSFCDSHQLHHRKLRFRSLQKVVEELDLLYSDYGVLNLRWQDDNVPLNLRNQRGLGKVLHERGILSRGSARADHIYREPAVLDDLWYAGFREIGYGIESAEDEVLKLMSKGTNVEQNRFALKETKRRGIRTRAFIMTGLPGETADSAEKMIDLLEETQPDVVTLTSFMPLPGCDIYSNPEKYGVEILTRDWSKYDIALKWDSGVAWTHRLSSIDLNGMERNREMLKGYLFNHGKSNVAAYNREYKTRA